MRMAIVVILLAAVGYFNAGCDGCQKKDNDDDAVKTDTTVTPTPVQAVITCSGATCTVAVYLGTGCSPETIDGVAMTSAGVNAGETLCFFNKMSEAATVTVPYALIEGGSPDGAPSKEFVLQYGECASLIVAASADKQTMSYSIKTATCTSGGGVGNPEVKVGGGSGGDGG